MTKFITVSFLLLAIVAGAFRATHHPVYSTTCTQTGEGCAHTLIKWKGNK